MIALMQCSIRAHTTMYTKVPRGVTPDLILFHAPAGLLHAQRKLIVHVPLLPQRGRLLSTSASTTHAPLRQQRRQIYIPGILRSLGPQ